MSCEHGVAVGERAAFAVLAAEADGFAVEEEGAEGEGFTHAPVVGAAVLVGLGDAALDEALDLGCDLEVGGDGGERLEHDAVDGARFALTAVATGVCVKLNVGLEDGGGAFEGVGRHTVSAAARLGVSRPW